ncbi:IS66 family transposase [Oceanobacillus kimchii]|uniref:IS66 family transposase n=1 Tax=Oceanobacillus kimchii TaxID=746691 RepID=UPI0035CCF64D
MAKSALGKNVKYCKSQWPKLEAFLLDGRLELVNNGTEREIKPSNWLFSNTRRVKQLNVSFLCNKKSIYIFSSLHNIYYRK